MFMIIKKKFTSETSHIVRNAISTRCKFNIHGHSYKWYVYIKGDVGEETGMVLDFKELKPVKEFIDLFDHSTILWREESEEFRNFFLTECKRVLIMRKNTTAENMARVVLKFTQDWLDSIGSKCKAHQVDVWETETGCAIANCFDESDNLIHQHKNDD